MASHEELELTIMSKGEQSSEKKRESTLSDNNPLKKGRTIEQVNKTLLWMSDKNNEEIFDEFEKKG